MGPKPSTERHTGKVPSIPKAAIPTPYIAAQRKEHKIVKDKQQTGITSEAYPRAIPLMTLLEESYKHALASS